MRKVRSLDVYKKTRDLARHIVYCVGPFRKNFRDSIGAEMLRCAVDSIVLICDANPLDEAGKIEKLTEVEKLLKRLDEYCHIAYDIRALEGKDKYSKAVFLCEDALDDVIKWRRYNAARVAKVNGTT